MAVGGHDHVLTMADRAEYRMMSRFIIPKYR